MMQTKYLTPGGYTVAVHSYVAGTQFRAFTNDVWLYVNHIEPLPYRDTEEEAQRDLDVLATTFDLRIEGNQ